MKQKKGQIIDQLYPLIIGLITIGIVLVIAFMITGEVKTNTESRMTTLSSVFEALTWSNGTYVALNNSGAGAFSLTCTGLMNDSLGNVPFGIGNISCNPSWGANVTQNDLEGPVVFNTTLYVNYTYTLKNAAFNASSDVQNATQDIPSWLPIFVITIIGSLLIGLIALFRRK